MLLAMTCDGTFYEFTIIDLRKLENKRTLTFSEVLKNMGELELTIGELYQTCGQLWPEHEAFWMDMKQTEMKHAHNINRMSKIISEGPRILG